MNIVDAEEKCTISINIPFKRLKDAFVPLNDLLGGLPTNNEELGTRIQESLTGNGE